MNQDEINEHEWRNPDNWGKRIGFYRDKQGSRVPSKPNWIAA